jgi:hypothetical protein
MASADRPLGPHTAGEEVTYAIDWKDDLNGSTIQARTVQLVRAAGLTLSNDAVSGTRVTFKLSGGTAGQTAKILCTVTTSAGETLISDAVCRVVGS